MGNHTTNMSSPNEINENVTGTQPVTDTSTHNLNDNPDPVLDEQKEPDAPAEQHEEKATDEAKEVVLAAHNGGMERLMALLEANPNLVDSVDAEDHTGAHNIGASALFCASRAGHVAVVQFLLTFGASVDLGKPNGATPLHVASQENHVEVVAVLLDGGASVDGGYTPLFAASAKNNWSDETAARCWGLKRYCRPRIHNGAKHISWRIHSPASSQTLQPHCRSGVARSMASDIPAPTHGCYNHRQLRSSEGVAPFRRRPTFHSAASATYTECTRSCKERSHMQLGRSS